MASADGCVLPVPRGKGQAVVLPQWDRSTPTCVGWDINYRDDRLVEDREKPVLDILSTPPPNTSHPGHTWRASAGYNCSAPGLPWRGGRPASARRPWCAPYLHTSMEAGGGRRRPLASGTGTAYALAHQLAAPPLQLQAPPLAQPLSHSRPTMPVIRRLPRHCQRGHHPAMDPPPVYSHQPQPQPQRRLPHRHHPPRQGPIQHQHQHQHRHRHRQRKRQRNLQFSCNLSAT